MTTELLLYPGRRGWIGTTTAEPPEWEVSNGPPGRRSHATSWGTPREAIDYARALGLTVTFDDDFRWEEPTAPGDPS